jgi:ParB family transcriptional regulator, chromosome partitioning protein
VATSKKKSEPKTKAAAPRKRKKKNEAEPKSRGLVAADIAGKSPPASVAGVTERIKESGGEPIGAFRDPLGGHWQVLATLPIDSVAPTPFQRDLSDSHVARLTDVINRLDRFLDPVIVVPSDEKNGGAQFWTPNGNHRLAAMRRLGAQQIVALVVPEKEVAFRILALNTEKAHNLREKALEVIRMARSLAELDDRPETDFALEFEEPSFLTLGITYEARGRFSGGAYHPILKRVEGFLDDRLSKALAVREERSKLLLDLDDAVVAAVNALKERGLTSPYLKAFVVARTNPIRFHKGEPPPFEETIAKMLTAAQKFDPSKVKPDQIAATGGAPSEE